MPKPDQKLPPLSAWHFAAPRTRLRELELGRRAEMEKPSYLQRLWRRVVRWFKDRPRIFKLRAFCRRVLDPKIDGSGWIIVSHDEYVQYAKLLDPVNWDVYAGLYYKDNSVLYEQKMATH